MDVLENNTAGRSSQSKILELSEKNCPSEDNVSGTERMREWVLGQEVWEEISDSGQKLP